MLLFYAPDITTPLYTLDEIESGHCVRVLRLQEGDTLNITDGRGTLYDAEVVDAHPKRCSVRIVAEHHNWEQRPYGLTVAVAPTKNLDRIEWMAEKCTEMGIDRLIPVRCRFSERKELKTERLQKILVSAMKQSLKSTLPQLDELTPVMAVIKMPFDGQKFICYCDDEVQRHNFAREYDPSHPVLILVGPEGDFSREEVNAALDNGFVAVTLGDSRLRTETAAVAACFTCHTKKQLAE